MNQKRAIFLDRDGVISKEINYLHRIEDFEFEDKALEGLKKIDFNKYLTFIIVNQAGIAKGMYKESDFLALDQWLKNRLKDEGIKIRKTYYCPHHPSGKIKKYRKRCTCRKPEIGLLLRAKNEFYLDLKKSWLIGDKTSDILAGHKAGCKTILTQTGYAGKDKLYKVRPGFVAQNLVDAIRIINHENNNRRHPTSSQRNK